MEHLAGKELQSNAATTVRIVKGLEVSMVAVEADTKKTAASLPQLVDVIRGKEAGILDLE